MDEIIGDAAGAVARRELARRHLGELEAALLEQVLWNDDDLMARQGRADDGMRTGHVVGEAVARHDVEVQAVLLEMRHAVGLEDDLDVGMLAQLDARDGMRDPVLACLDLAQLQARDRREIDPALERGPLERVDVELTAEVSERIRPALDLPLGRQSVRAE
jgi:hypothetical protein